MIETNEYVISMHNACLTFDVKKGSPVLISVPHDGLSFLTFSGLFEARKTGYRGRDKNIWLVAKEILLSTPVNALCGLMPRSLVDYNRAWPEGINYYPLTQKEVHSALDDERLL